MDWAAFVVMHFVAWTNGLITNCRAIFISGVGVILTILRHRIRIYIYIYISGKQLLWVGLKPTIILGGVA